MIPCSRGGWRELASSGWLSLRITREGMNVLTSTRPGPATSSSLARRIHTGSATASSLRRRSPRLGIITDVHGDQGIIIDDFRDEAHAAVDERADSEAVDGVLSHLVIRSAGHHDGMLVVDQGGRTHAQTDDLQEQQRARVASTVPPHSPEQGIPANLPDDTVGHAHKNGGDRGTGLGVLLVSGPRPLRHDGIGDHGGDPLPFLDERLLHHVRDLNLEFAAHIGQVQRELVRQEQVMREILVEHLLPNDGGEKRVIMGGKDGDVGGRVSDHEGPVHGQEHLPEKAEHHGHPAHAAHTVQEVLELTGKAGRLGAFGRGLGRVRRRGVGLWLGRPLEEALVDLAPRALDPSP